MSTSDAPLLRWEGASVRYQRADGAPVAALTSLSLDVQRGECLCLIGPSGCGKTTALRLVNRLIEPTAGCVFVEGSDVAGVDPIRLRRSIGYVLQSAGLFPHLSVRANVGLLCGLEGWEEARTRRRVDELLALVHLDPARFGERFPRELSGGQQQRVGIARALALDPPILLLDEPFGALDPITREELQGEFAELKRALGKTLLLVSHDLREAFLLGDRVAILRAGALLQVGAREELTARPADPFVERFLVGLGDA